MGWRLGHVKGRAHKRGKNLNTTCVPTPHLDAQHVDSAPQLDAS